MKKYFDEELGVTISESDCAYEHLWMIWAVGCDYDGCQTVDEFKKLVDELVGWAQKGIDCLHEGKIFPEGT